MKSKTEAETPIGHPAHKRWNRNVEVRVATAAEHEWFDAQLHDRHYLGAGHPVGDYLRQIVERGGQAVALLAWGPACYALKDRDRWVGWDATRRVERLSLVVQNRRFLLLTQRGEEPNLASQALGAAVRALPDHWLERFNYRPLLGETFTDPEAYQGTCYKASGWEPVGTSQGYERHRGDFYREHGKPKRLWLRCLHPSAKALLRAPIPLCLKSAGRDCAERPPAPCHLRTLSCPPCWRPCAACPTRAPKTPASRSARS